MTLIRKAHRSNLMLWLLALTVGLRALIAPGFMLEVNGDGPLGLGIVLCDGFSSLTQTEPAEDPHASHKHHGSDNSKDDVTTGMAGQTCALWATSSTFVESNAIVSDQLVPLGPDEYVVRLDSLTAPLYRQQPQQPRAPPVSRIS